jgi:prepilin-type N-terminal cleavage/methylation domain-containing protein
MLLQRSRFFAVQPASTTTGLTMIELLAVVTIVGILMAIAAPVWNSFLNARTLDNAQDQAFQLMRQAQTEAMQHRVPWRASFQVTNGVVQGTTHNADALPVGTNWQKFNPIVQIDTVETTLAQSSGMYRVEFDHNGRVNGQLGRLTFMGVTGGRTKRCIVVSTLLGVLRKAQNQATPDSGGRFCY